MVGRLNLPFVQSGFSRKFGLHIVCIFSLGGVFAPSSEAAASVPRSLDVEFAGIPLFGVPVGSPPAGDAEFGSIFQLR